jgi:hypothetical protein
MKHASDDNTHVSPTKRLRGRTDANKKKEKNHGVSPKLSAFSSSSSSSASSSSSSPSSYSLP